MKEEVAMKRRGPTWALVGLAAAGVLALSGTTASAVWTEAGDIYTNDTGLSGADFATGGTSGMHVNPGGIGQYLVGYYDTRYHKTSGTINNIQIMNTNSNDPQAPNYNEWGGSLVKVRFRESFTSREAYDFVIALSCGEVWAGRIKQNEDLTPVITSDYPVVDANPTSTGGGYSAGAITTRPLFKDGGVGSLPEAYRRFFFNYPVGPLPWGVTEPDFRRGYIEVINMEALPCEPDNAAKTPNAGKVSFLGNTWSRLAVADQTPLNNISATVFLVRAAAGISFASNMTAVANFVNAGEGSVTPSEGITSASPTWGNCKNFDIAGSALTAEQCVNQANLALSTSRLLAQYDTDPATLAGTNLTVIFPTKYANCGVYTSGVATKGWNGTKLVANTPFSCANGGEVARCTIYDRMENIRIDEEIPVSPLPPEAGPCALKREVNILSFDLEGDIGDTHSPFQADPGQNYSSGDLPYPESGWFELNLAAGGAVSYLKAGTYDILGGYVGGFRGLPAIGTVFQDFENQNLTGGLYGNAVPAITEQDILFGGS